MVDAGDGRSAGIDAFNPELFPDVQDAVGQLIAFIGRLVVTDEQYQIFAAAGVFPVEELALGEIGLIDNVVPDEHTDGVEEVRGFQVPQFFKVEFGFEVVGYNHSDVADAGPGRQQVGLTKLGPGSDFYDIAHFNSPLYPSLLIGEGDKTRHFLKGNNS